MTETVCKSKSAALAALDVVAETMQKGTARDVLLAIKKWISENISDTLLPEEVQQRIKLIFEGTAGEQKGRAWIQKELENSSYIPGYPHKTITEPEDGAELSCVWSAERKAWEPTCSWLPITPRQDEAPDEDGE